MNLGFDEAVNESANASSYGEEEVQETETQTSEETKSTEEVEQKTTTTEESATKEATTEEKATEEAPEGISISTKNGSIRLSNLDEAKKFIENNKPSTTTDTLALAKEQLGISDKELALISAAKKGDTKALATILKETGMELSELFEKVEAEKDDFDEEFRLDTPTPEESYLRENFSDEEGENFAKTAFSAGEDFASEIISSVENIKAFRSQIESGLAGELLPGAIKKAAINGTSVFEEYAKAGHARVEAEKAQEKTTKNEPAQKANGISEEAGKKEYTEDEIWAMSPEEFREKFDYQPAI